MARIAKVMIHGSTTSDSTIYCASSSSRKSSVREVETDDRPEDHSSKCNDRFSPWAFSSQDQDLGGQLSSRGLVSEETFLAGDVEPWCCTDFMKSELVLRASDSEMRTLWMCHVPSIVIYIDGGLSPTFGDGPRPS